MCNLTDEDRKKLEAQYKVVPAEVNKNAETLVIKLDGGLGRNIAFTGMISAVAQKRPVKVVCSRPLAFWGNPYIKSVHGLGDRRLFQDVIRGNDYIELEPYTDPEFFNDGKNWLYIAKKQLGIELNEIPQPQLFLAEHEKILNKLPGDQNKIILFQPFGSVVKDEVGADRSYRSLYVKDAQYLANKLIQKGYKLYEVIRKGQPEIAGCEILDTEDLRFVVSLCARYPVLGCDSCLHHASKAFGKQATVIRAGTDAERYGYESNRNFREFPMVAHTPLRLNMNDFNFDVSNQHTNQFTTGFLDKIIELY